MAGVPLHHVDAFASEPFTGNPAAVCLLDDVAGDAWMQAVAAEMNLSETAFVRPLGSGPIERAWELRWFTPTTEVQLCGHATLASAHTLWETGRLEPGTPARFRTRFRGELRARRAADTLVELDFPADPPVPAPLPAGMAAALGATPVSTARARVGFVVELESPETVRTLRPDLVGLAALESVVVTCATGPDDDCDFVSRYFAPAYGIPEDPVTGAAHCALGPFWAERLGREELRGYQASARGGSVAVRVAGDRVGLGGRAVTVARGELTMEVAS
ncbi:MAG TPA: PhzF family phenazine biosynthesis protein [Acidimicrobiia bacterium]